MTDNLGPKFRALRESRQISLEEIAQKTHIRLEYLEALETGDTQLLPEGPQRRGFLRLYASELGLDVDGPEIEDIQTLTEGEDPSQNTSESQGLEDLDAAPHAPFEDEVRARQVAPSQPEPHRLIPDKEEPQAAPHTARRIFSDLGHTLQQRRELLSLSIEDIHDHIHIRKQFLNAMEAGEFSALPSPVQARGMLSNYADFLDLDVDEILLQYADGLQQQRVEKAKGISPPGSASGKTLSKTRLRLKNFFSLDLLVIAALLIGFAAFVVWGLNRILDTNEPAASPTDLPEVADVLLATGSPTPQATSLPVEQDPVQDQTGTPALQESTPIFTPLPNDSPINVVIIPRQRAWVRIISDGETLFEGRMLPGDAYDFSAEENLEILTGSAGALQVFYNEQDIGAPGLVGQVANLIFTEDGLILPTPTQTPTITDTPDATLTPTPTATPTQTLQPSATSTEPND